MILQGDAARVIKSQVSRNLGLCLCRLSLRASGRRLRCGGTNKRGMTCDEQKLFAQLFHHASC